MVMQINLDNVIKANETIGVAVSGGSDSMALLHYLLNNTKKYEYKVIAINIEHGIRGEQSKFDTDFVKSYCKEQGIELLTYSVDCVSYAKNNKLSLEQAGRILRYECFYQTITDKKCDKIATAHHLKDNFESVLFNLLRGTGLKGLAGIEENHSKKIIRPFLSVSKQEIEDYVSKNQIPFVTDETNFDDKYTRNAIRLNLLPQIEQLFPEAQKSVFRLSQIAKVEDEYMQTQAQASLNLDDGKAQLCLPQHPAIIARTTVIALKHLGVEKDWEKAHIDSVIDLSQLDNGKKVDLPKGVVAIKEYDKIVFYKNLKKSDTILPFNVGIIEFDGKVLSILESTATDFKNGFYCDKDKIPLDAAIRTRRDNDKFTKFGGGTKSLSDFLTDKKVPLAIRDSLPLIAVNNDVLAIFGLAISDKIKIDENTKTILQLK